MDINRQEVEDAVRFYDRQNGPLLQSLVEAAKAWLELRKVKDADANSSPPTSTRTD